VNTGDLAKDGVLEKDKFDCNHERFYSAVQLRNCIDWSALREAVDFLKREPDGRKAKATRAKDQRTLESLSLIEAYWGLWGLLHSTTCNARYFDPRGTSMMQAVQRPSRAPGAGQPGFFFWGALIVRRSHSTRPDVAGRRGRMKTRRCCPPEARALTKTLCSRVMIVDDRHEHQETTG